VTVYSNMLTYFQTDGLFNERGVNMLQELMDEGIMIFPFIIGGIAILLAIFGNRTLQATGLKSRSELFKNPRFQQSAEVTEWLGRLFLLAFGVGYLVEGVGGLWFSAEVVDVVSAVFLVVAVLIVLVMVGVVVFNWRG
jgi:cation transporter-like permease